MKYALMGLVVSLMTTTAYAFEHKLPDGSEVMHDDKQDSCVFARELTIQMGYEEGFIEYLVGFNTEFAEELFGSCEGE